MSRVPKLLIAFAGAVASLQLLSLTMNAEPAEISEDMDTSRRQTLVLGGGCFWCVEAAYQLVDGVTKVESGYAGGSVANPTYEQVCTGNTGHAEVVRIEFDPAIVSLRELLDFFWEAHDPTTLNRQGADVGPQYRSIILYQDEEQKRAAEESLSAARERFDNPIVTQVVSLGTFYVAEVSHQDYYARNPNAGYCRFVIARR
jgi:peptide-methionine (S)-S-oxide reductase